MYCIFCPAADLPALWAYRGLLQRGLTPLEIFTPEALVFNRRLEHRLLGGETITQIELADGRVLDSAGVRGGLNRIYGLPLEHFSAANPEDRAYAAQEQQAVFLSWMYSLPGSIINRPGPRGLCGDFRSTAEWVWLAGQAGLPARPIYRNEAGLVDNAQHGATFQLIVLDGEIFGMQTISVSETFVFCITRLAQLSGLRLLGAEFQLDPEGKPWFVSATPLPNLCLGGEAFLDALARALE